MERSVNRLSLAVCLALLVAGLFGCSNGEEKAQAKYNEAYRAEQAGGAIDAEALYSQLINEFPATAAAEQAQVRLALLKGKSQIENRRQAQEVLGSLQLVVEGYHSVFRNWPQSATDFDKPKYIFDSDYMAETVGDRSTVYLALAGGGDGYDLWSFPAQGDVGYQLKGKQNSVVEVSRQQTLNEIEAAYRVESQKGKLIFLVPGS